MSTQSLPDTLREPVLRDALKGLLVPAGQQKSLPPWLFYDERGTELFQQITRLPEYYLTRTERGILAENAETIVQSAGKTITVAELGSGTAEKTGLLLATAVRHQSTVLYQPIDVSLAALEKAAEALTRAIPGVTVRPQLANYIDDGYTIERPKDGCVLALYIGSSIGNFSPEQTAAILRELRNHLKSVGDTMLLGIDLAPSCTKSVDLLLAAYDDAEGVTAAFNKNILTRLNRDLGADFDLESFAHRVRWNAQESRIEMHLESLLAQEVHIEGHRIAFTRGETIHTENSYKFTERGVRALLLEAGFSSPQWFEDEQHHFGVVLAYSA